MPEVPEAAYPAIISEQALRWMRRAVRALPALEYIARQPCDAWAALGKCAEHYDKLDEYCYPCYAKAALEASGKMTTGAK
jgi:hypothetical protein